MNSFGEAQVNIYQGKEHPFYRSRASQSHCLHYIKCKRLDDRDQEDSKTKMLYWAAL